MLWAMMGILGRWGGGCGFGIVMVMVMVRGGSE